MLQEVRIKHMDSNIFLKEYFSPLLAIIAGILAFNYFNGFWKLLFIQVLLYVLTIKIVYEITPGLQTNSNHWFYNGYLIIEVGLLCIAPLFYFKDKAAKRSIILSYIFYLLTFVAQLYFGGLERFANYAFAAAGLVLSVIYGSILFLEFRSGIKWQSSPLIWMSAGLILFFACNIPYFSLFNYLNKYYLTESRFLFNFITDVLANIRYLLLAFSFFLLRRNYLLSQNPQS